MPSPRCLPTGRVLTADNWLKTLRAIYRSIRQDNKIMYEYTWQYYLSVLLSFLVDVQSGPGGFYFTTAQQFVFEREVIKKGRHPDPEGMQLNSSSLAWPPWSWICPRMWPLEHRRPSRQRTTAPSDGQHLKFWGLGYWLIRRAAPRVWSKGYWENPCSAIWWAIRLGWRTCGVIYAAFRKSSPSCRI